MALYLLEWSSRGAWEPEDFRLPIFGKLVLRRTVAHRVRARPQLDKNSKCLRKFDYRDYAQTGDRQDEPGEPKQ